MGDVYNKEFVAAAETGDLKTLRKMLSDPAKMRSMLSDDIASSFAHALMSAVRGHKHQSIYLLLGDKRVLNALVKKDVQCIGTALSEAELQGDKKCVVAIIKHAGRNQTAASVIQKQAFVHQGISFAWEMFQAMSQREKPAAAAEVEKPPTGKKK